MKRVFLLLLLTCCLLTAPAAAAGGSGTAADPYIIETPAELQSIQNNLGAYYVLGNDINLQDYSFTPIGSTSAPFSGSLDGNSHTIKNLYLSTSTAHTGLFSAITSGVTIKDVIFQDCTVTSTAPQCAIVIGSILSSSTDTILLSNVDCIRCSATSNTNYVGCLSGQIYQSAVVDIINCDINYCNIGSTGGYNIGGIVGRSHDSSITEYTNCNLLNSYVFGSGNNLGGYIGSCGTTSTLTIDSCFAKNNIIECIGSSNIVSYGCFVGVINGESSFNALNCNAINCIVAAPQITGGILGYCGDADSVCTIQSCSVSDCTIISNSDYAGGIVARSLSTCTIQSCSVSDCTIISNSDYAGGICPTIPTSSNSITGCTVADTNINAGSNAFDIGPSGSYDSTSTASGITNVPNRYLYASGLTATPNGATVSYTLEGQQGSTSVEATQGTAQSWAWEFGDGATSSVAEDTIHTYAAPGTYSTSLTLKNYLDSTGVTVTTSGYNILPIPPTVSASANVLQLGQSTTLSAVGTLFSTIQWQYSTDSGATWQDISGATTATYEWTPTSGVYQVRAHVTAVGTGFTANSNVLTVSVYAPPTITDVSASPIVVTAWPQQITLSATVSDNGPDATTYQWQQQAIGTSTWQDISGATTATYTASQTINSATQYRLIATGTGGQTTSDTVWIYPKPTATVSAATGTPTTSITLSADKTYGATTIQWEYSTNGASTWQDISGATTATYSWTPQIAASYTVRAEVTYGQYTLYSTYAYFAIYNPPSITAVTVSPTIGQYTETITLSAEVTDSGPDATTYQWQQSPQNQNTWTNIPGATTAQWIGQLTFSGATDFRLIATGTGGTTTSATTTYYIALPGEIQSLSATPSVVALPGSTTLSATGANVITWEWQELISGTWTTIGYGASLQESLTTEGTYTYRVLATGADGTTITSETVEVLAGYAPTVSITSPANNAELSAGNSVTAQATITGTDVVYQWSLGADGVGNLNTNPTTITYTSQGYKTITITAESIFGTATDSVTILYGKAPRPMQTELFEEVDTTPVTNFVNQFDVEPGEMPNPVGIVASLFAPFDDALKGFFWVLMFGAVMLVVWLISKNIAIPSVLGILFGSFMIGFMPDMYLYPAVALIAAGCAGGLVYVVRKN